MRFGTDLAQSVPIRWFACAPGAEDLGLRTPFISRNDINPGAWPDLGEVEYTHRYDGAGIAIPLPGTSGPCGDPAVWAGGYPGTVPPNYPLNDFGVPPCCDVLSAVFGQPTLGLLAYPSPLPLRWQAWALPRRQLAREHQLERRPLRWCPQPPVEPPAAAPMRRTRQQQGNAEDRLDRFRGLVVPANLDAVGPLRLRRQEQQEGGPPPPRLLCPVIPFVELRRLRPAKPDEDDVPRRRVVNGIDYLPPAVIKNTGHGANTVVANRLDLTWATSTTAGSMLYAGLVVRSGVTVTPPSGWTLLSTAAYGSSLVLWVYARWNSPSVSTTQFGLSPNALGCVAGTEIGNLLFSSVDQVGIAAATGTAMSVGPTPITTGTYEVGVCAVAGSGSGDGTSAWGNGFSSGATANNGSTSIISLGLIVLNGVHTVNPVCTMALNAAWSAYLATFK